MKTPRGNRRHIGIFGATNAGKSTLLNLLTHQDISLVSKERGTTTDPVYKNMEIPQLGPAVLIDTAGLCDESKLGDLREKRSRKVMEECDLFLLVLREEIELPFFEDLKSYKKPILIINNGIKSRDYLKRYGEGHEILPMDRRKILEEIGRTIKAGEDNQLLAGLVKPGDTVLLVMPQDESAPKGRLILPQVQTIRSLLDERAVSICADLETLPTALEKLREPPALIITDSQVFHEVYQLKPKETKLTSFSVLYAAKKGDLKTLVEGAKAIFHLRKDAKILLLEACTHAPTHEDIGRVKIPRLIKKVLPSAKISHLCGKDFPRDIGSYDLVIMCGSCMLNQTLVLNRIQKIKKEKIPVTNYGLTIAALTGILDKIDL